MDRTIPLIQVDEQVDEPATPFDTLYHREYHAMVRMATALVDYQEKAEEVVQEAFAQLYMRYAQVDNPVAYLRVSVLNGCRRALRRRRLARALHAKSQRDVDRDGELGFNHMLDAVRRLPTTQCNAVTLRYELQLTDAEIAATLGIPLGTVKSNLHRALIRLRTEVQQ
jgi:RNA polymerase sigma factor (sigma-70 family)